MPNYVKGEGNGYAKLMIVGEAPGKDEDESGRPFVGRAGEELDSILESANISRGDVWLTNVYKYRPPDNKIYRIKEIIADPEKHIEEHLFQEIRDVNPNCILALGNTALRALTRHTGIDKYRGSILMSPMTGVKVVPSYHPAAFLYSGWSAKDKEEIEATGGKVPYHMKYVSILDYARAKEESLNAKLSLPQRNIIIARNSGDIWSFLNGYGGNGLPAIDIEVIKTIPVSISLSFDGYNAIVFPLINLGRLQEEWAIPHAELAYMQRYTIEYLNDKAKYIIGQNYKFDQSKLEQSMKWLKFGLKRDIRVVDLTILAQALHSEFPKKLGFLSSIYTREPFYKDEGKEFDYRKKNFRDFFIYNGKDACVEWEVCFELIKELQGMQVPNFPNWYHEFVEDYLLHTHYFYKDIESVGLRVDPDKKKFYFDKYTEIYDKQRQRLNEIAGFNCNPHSSVKDVPLFLYKVLGLPRRKDTSRQTMVALLNNVAKQPRQKEGIQLILDSRRTRKARNTYYGAELDYDGRMRTSYNPNGTETGRSSTQILKPPVRPVKMGIAFQTMTKHGDIGHELREMFIPDPGFAFVEIDLSQAEARVVAKLSNDELLLDKFKRGLDVHSELAYFILERRWNGERANKEDRFIGKMGRHARNYDVGKRTFMQQVNAEAKKHGINLNISEFRAGKILDRVKATTPLVENVFHKGIQNGLIVDRFLVTPHGRFRKFYGRWGDELFKEAYAFIPQATVIDHLRQACFRAKKRLDKNKYFWVIEAHDAMVALVRLDYIRDYVLIMQEELDKPIDFSRCSIPRDELVIPSEAQVGYKNLKELEPYHVN